jgi:hypothetical protein
MIIKPRKSLITKRSLIIGAPAIVAASSLFPRKAEAATLAWQPLVSGVFAPPNGGPSAAAGFSFRMACNTLLVNGQGQVSVNLANLVGGGSNFIIDHVSIGQASAGGPGITGTFGSSTFVELKYGGVSGVTLVTSVPQDSDFTNFFNFVAGTDVLLVTFDCNASSPVGAGFTASPTNGNSFFRSGAWYNDGTTTTGWNTTPNTYEIQSINTQAGAGGGGKNLNLLGTKRINDSQ